MSVSLISPLDVIALLMALTFGVRLSWLRARHAAEQPQVSPSDFEGWRRAESWAAALLVIVCAVKAAVSPLWLWLSGGWGLSAEAIQGVRRAIDVGWLALVVLAMLKRRSARQLAERLGIDAAHWSKWLFL